MGIKKDLTGQKFGKLLVLNEIPFEERKNPKQVEWLCQCDCGNKTRVITSYLNSGHTKSCGCAKREKRNIQINDLTGQKFNHLTVLERTEKQYTDHSYLWKCECECGRIVLATSTWLKKGIVKSCGCKRELSKGEKKLNELLYKLNYNYQTQYWFDDLLTTKNYHLYFDFGILDENKNIICLIEYQGQQHYEDIEFFSKQNSFENRQKKDEMKRQYCKKKNIPLLEISYQEYNLLSTEYLQMRIKETINHAIL